MAGDQKKAAQEGRTLVWIDESAFYLLPALVSGVLLAYHEMTEKGVPKTPQPESD